MIKITKSFLVRIQDSHFNKDNPQKVHTTKNDSRRRPHNSEEGSIDGICFSHFDCEVWEYLQVPKTVMTICTHSLHETILAQTNMAQALQTR